MTRSSRKKFYQNSAKPVNYLPNVLVTDTPSFPPTMSGLMQINPVTKDIWISAGKELVSDWINIVGGGGSSITLLTNGSVNANQSILNLYSNDGSIQLTDDGTGGVDFSVTAGKNGKQFVVLVADEVVSLSSAFIAVPNFEMPALSGYTYSFRIFCPFDIDDPAYGTRWALRGPDPSPLYLGYSTTAPGSTVNNFIFNASITTYDGTTNVAGTTVSPTGNMAIIEGLFTPSENTSLAVRVSNDGGGGAANLTVKAGAYIEYLETAL